MRVLVYALVRAPVVVLVLVVVTILAQLIQVAVDVLVVVRQLVEAVLAALDAQETALASVKIAARLTVQDVALLVAVNVKELVLAAVAEDVIVAAVVVVAIVVQVLVITPVREYAMVLVLVSAMAALAVVIAAAQELAEEAVARYVHPHVLGHVNPDAPDVPILVTVLVRATVNHRVRMNAPIRVAVAVPSIVARHAEDIARVAVIALAQVPALKNALLVALVRVQQTVLVGALDAQEHVVVVQLALMAVQDYVWTLALTDVRAQCLVILVLNHLQVLLALRQVQAQQGFLVEAVLQRVVLDVLVAVKDALVVLLVVAQNAVINVLLAVKANVNHLVIPAVAPLVGPVQKLVNI